MSTNVGSIHYDVKLDTSKFDSAASKLSGGLKAIGTSAEKLAIPIMAAGAAAVGFGVLSVKAYNESVEAGTKLRTNLLNVKGATEQQVQSLMGLATQLQKTGVIQDDVIVAGMSQLATFNLQADSIGKLTPKITDMVAQLKGHNATAEDMVQINNLVGKVMTGNVGALGRYGVTLSDSQAKILQNGNEAQRTAMLIEVLGQNYGKVNEALRNTPQGRITALKNSFNDFQEIVGASLTKVFDPLVKRFQNWVDSMGGAEGAMQKLEDLVKNNQDKLKLFAIFVGTILTAAFASWAVSVIAATWPILAVAAGITLLYLAFKKYEPQIKKVVDKFKDFWNTIKPIREFLVNQFKKAWEDLTNAIDRIKKQLEPFEKQIKQIGIIIGIIVIGPFALFMAAILGTIAVIVIIVTFIARLIGWFAQLQAKVMEVASNINQWFKDLPGKIWGFMSSAGSWLVDAGKNLINGLLNGIKNKWTEVWNFLTGIAGGVKSAVSNLWGALWDNGWHLMNSLWEGMKNVWNKVTEWVKGLATWIKKNKGPIDKDRKMLVNEGNAIMVGLNRGLLSGYRVVQDTIASINNSISKSIQPSLVVTGNAPTGNTSVNNNIYGNITLGDQGAVDRFFDQLNRNNELARRGMTTV